LDLIQDFFLETWDGLVTRYDPTRGQLGTYVYGAFVRFARRRIIRMQRWSVLLVDTASLARLLEEQAVTRQTGPSPHDLLTVAEALAQLPGRQRDILCDLACGHSERELARHLSLTRYQLRELLVDALGHVAVALGEPGRLSAPDWQIAVAVWRQGRSVRETAAFLNLSIPEVRAARHRILDLLASGLKGSLPASQKDKEVDHGE